MMFGTDTSPLKQSRDFLGQVLPMGQQDDGGQDGELGRPEGIGEQVETDQRQTNEREQPGQDGFSNEDEPRQKQQGKTGGQVRVEHQETTEGCGDAFAAPKLELRRPNMTYHNG